MARAKQVHVVWVKRDRLWNIKISGKYLLKGGYRTKADAERRAKKEARKLKAELTIHNKNGEISRKHSYGNDPRGSKG